MKNEFFFTISSVIFRPKDPYRNRPLPHLIGSKDWQEKWHIGLVDSDADEDSDIEPIDEVSSSSSSSSPSMASLHSHVPASMSESENSVWGIDATAAVSATGPSHSNGSTSNTLIRNLWCDFYFGFLYFAVKRDIFNESSEDDEGNNNNKSSMPISSSTNVNRQSGLRDDLVNRVQKTNDSIPNTIFRQQPQPTARAQLSANLFDSEPPELDDSPSSTQNADRKPVNLFLEDDDNAALESTQQLRESNAKVIESKAIKSINLFEDDEFDDELFGSSVTSENKPKPSSATNATKSSILSSVPPKNTLFQSLFDDEPPEDDFDFLTKPNATAITVSKSYVPENVKNVPKTPEPSSDMARKAPAKQLISKINLFDDDDEEEDSFEKLIGSKVETVSRKEVVQPPPFDDNGDDERIQPKEEIVDKLKSIPAPDDEQIFIGKKGVDVVEKTPLLSKNLFDDDSYLDDPFLDAPTTKTNAPKLSISDNNDDLFEPVAEKKEEKPTFNYASSHLFDDLPPDDDDDFMATPALTETAKQPGEFYNDFSETVTVSNADATKSQYSYLFNDEPPPDEDLFQSAKPKKSIAKDSKFSEKLNVFAHSEKVVDEASKAVTNKPKKLNIGNFDINVAALLPGAKRTVGNIKNEAVPTSDRAEDEIESVPSATIAKRVDIENVDDAGRLKNLTRNRAKIQTRRPSTRRGRQQQYQQSLEVADDSEVTSNPEIVSKEPISENAENTVAIEKEATPNKPSAVSDDIEEKVQLVTKPVDTSSANISITPVAIDDKVQPETKTALDPIPNDEFAARVVERPPATKSTDLSFLDESDGEAPDDDDWLSNVLGSNAKASIKSQVSQEIGSKTNTEASLFDAKDKNESIAEMSAAEPSVNTISSLAFSSDKPPPLLQSNSLFDDLEESEDDEDIFAPRPEQAAAPVSAQAAVPVLVQVAVPIPAKTSSSLFDDEDGDDDGDLFSKSPPLPEPNRAVITRPAVQPTKSLFGDELSDDDDEDLFGASKGTKKEAKTVAATSDKATVLNNKKVVTGKLFSDSDGDDDDDDLFGSKAKPSPIVAKKSVAPNATQKRITKAKAASVTDQDPLADLLK